MSKEEREAMHKEKLSLPSYGKQAKDARERNLKRVKERNERIRKK